MRRGRMLYYYYYVSHLEKLEKAPQTCPQRPNIFRLTDRLFTCVYDTSCVWAMFDWWVFDWWVWVFYLVLVFYSVNYSWTPFDDDDDDWYSIVNIHFYSEQEEAAAHAVCLGSYTARMVTMAVTRLVWFDSARTLRMVAVVFLARLARRVWWQWLGSHNARSGRCSWHLAIIFLLVPHPKY